jgi:hypothetical protein
VPFAVRYSVGHPRHHYAPLGVITATATATGAPRTVLAARRGKVLDAISAFCTGEATGLRALDSASRWMGELTDDTSTRAAALRGKRPRVLRRPDRVELAILTALADTYGSEILHNASLGYALRLVARHGGVALVQRVLWGEAALICNWPRCWAPRVPRSPRSRSPLATI